MNKVGRNEPCTCGSGKKYKKCCGKNNVIAFNPLYLEEELQRLHDGLINFALENYEEELEEIVMHNVSFYVDACTKEEKISYTNLMLPWVMIHEPIEHRTIYQVFAKRNLKRIRNEKVKKAFLAWENAPSSVYEIIAIDDREKNKMTVQNLLTDETYQVIDKKAEESKQGDFIIGTLLPGLESNQYLFATVEIASEFEEDIRQAMVEVHANQAMMNEIYPEIVGDIFASDAKDLEWVDPIYEEVAKVFANHMDLKDADEDYINLGIAFWNYYSNKHIPYVAKSAAYAAALDYVIVNNYMESAGVTQAALAKEYGVSAGTISAHNRKFIEEISLFEELYTGDGDLFESPQLAMPRNEFGLEEEIHQLHKLIGDQEFESEEALSAFLDDVIANDKLKDIRTDDSSVETAQELIYQAGGVQGGKREKLIEQAIQMDPTNVDARVMLADSERDFGKKHDLLVEAIMIAERQLGKPFFKENKGHFWGIFETRPYMRAKASFANLLASTGRKEEAIDVYEELLVLNPGDNQGIRYVLLRLYLENELYEAADRLIKRYGEYKDTELMYSHALLQFLIEGKTAKTKRLFKEAVVNNAHVVDYLTGRKRIPKALPPHYQIGGDSEAVIYAAENFHLWIDVINLLLEND